MARKTVTITCDRCGENAEDPECKGVAVAMMNARVGVFNMIRVGVFNMMGIREDLYPNQLDLCGKCTKDLVSFMQNEPPKHEGSDVCGVCAQRIGVVFEPHMGRHEADRGGGRAGRHRQGWGLAVTLADIGSHIRRLRQQQGRGQGWLARQAEITQAYLSQIENGHRSPALSTANKLLETLGAQELPRVQRVGRFTTQLVEDNAGSTYVEVTLSNADGSIVNTLSLSPLDFTRAITQGRSVKVTYR